MTTLTTAEFAVRLAVGVGCGSVIGFERQWRSRMAGLRTNALVATGATLFVLYSVAASDTSSTRVASYVVSGIGFLGGGVILSEGFNVRGLNTAATLWCSAAVGVLAASGQIAFALIATGVIVAIHVVGRPLGRVIERGDFAEADEGLQPYRMQIVCLVEAQKWVRSQIVERTGEQHIMLSGITVSDVGDDAVALTAILLLEGHSPARIERLLAELSLQTDVMQINWCLGSAEAT